MTRSVMPESSGEFPYVSDAISAGTLVGGKVPPPRDTPGWVARPRDRWPKIGFYISSIRYQHAQGLELSHNVDLWTRTWCWISPNLPKPRLLQSVMEFMWKFLIEICGPENGEPEETEGSILYDITYVKMWLFWNLLSQGIWAVSLSRGGNVQWRDVLAEQLLLLFFLFIQLSLYLFIHMSIRQLDRIHAIVWVFYSNNLLIVYIERVTHLPYRSPVLTHKWSVHVLKYDQRINKQKKETKSSKSWI